MADHQTESELAALRHLYEQPDHNPLYVWRAIAVALFAEPIVPEWCLPYLHDAALKLTSLSAPRRSYPWSKGKIKSKGKNKPNHAQVLKALSLSSQGSNVFDALQIDRRDMAAAIKHSSPFMRKTGLAVKAIREELPLSSRTKRKVKSDRAQRLLARGDRLQPPRRNFS